ncbi:MAG: alpha/beta hydrolase [Acidobacteria bacterium]|nr:alpha/beta hydrolase [Acidobacteriota bacterium]
MPAQRSRDAHARLVLVPRSAAARIRCAALRLSRQGQSSDEDLPLTIPELAGYLEGIMDELALPTVHVMGISYGGFVAAEFARLCPQRTATLALSGILLGRETLFDMYQAISLAFYERGRDTFGLYTQYMYEKIFGERFVSKIKDGLEPMRQRFLERYQDRVHSLVQLTLAQNPYFAATDADPMLYRAIEAPTMIIAGEHDRVIPPWVQKKITRQVKQARFVVFPSCGHVVYIEEPDAFFGTLTRFMREGRSECEVVLPAPGE